MISARDKARSEQKAFQELASQIRAARDRFVKVRSRADRNISIDRYSINAEMADISIKIKTIGIDVPESTEGESIVNVVDRWTKYLSILLPLSEMAAVDKAKAISITDKEITLDL